MNKGRRVTLVLVLGALVACGLQGCAARVQPWERANLADYTMSADRDPLNAAMTDHIFFSREASTGGRGVGGGGCGCN
jgi:hypothetical protein